MTRGTVAAQCKGLAIGAVNRRQAAVGIMTVRTGIMRCRISAYQRRITMAAGAVTRIYLD